MVWRLGSARLAIVAVIAGVWLGLPFGLRTAAAQRNDKRTLSESPYVHVIDLLDVNGRKIDAKAGDGPPYSPQQTCMKCHDVPTISHGWHFSGSLADPERSAELAGRPGEPWIWSDPRSGTAIPISARGWKGTFAPSEVSLTAFRFATRFGAFTPGGGIAGPDAVAARAGDEDAGRFQISGALGIDCLVCHASGRAFRHETYAEQIEEQNFAWASSAAIGWAEVTGSTSRLPDDFDVLADGARDQLPKVSWNPARFEPDGKVFVDVQRAPEDAACYRCHTTRWTDAFAVKDATSGSSPGDSEADPAATSFAQDVGPHWARDPDVHQSAGLSCVDCHPNGIDHQTVRGLKEESHSLVSVAASFSCRGCHLGDERGGRFGAPKPEHKGLPPIHLETMSCTACHSGALPAMEALGVQTSKAHAFAIATQTRTDQDPPAIVEPVYLRAADGLITPHRMMWPAFFGFEQDGVVSPLGPEEAYDALKKAKVRIRGDFRVEIGAVKFGTAERVQAIGEDAAKKTDADLDPPERVALAAFERRLSEEAVQDNVKRALAYLRESRPEEGTPIYVSGGKSYRVGEDDRLTVKEIEAARPYAWPIAHRVRPARQALGARGCTECHAADAPFFYGSVTAAGPLPDPTPIRADQRELMGLDATLLSQWETSFQGRGAFKWVGTICVSLVGLAILTMVVATFAGMFSSPHRSPD